MPRLKEVEAAMSDYFTAQMERAGTGLELLPGVRELLQALRVGAERGRGVQGGWVRLKQTANTTCRQLLQHVLVCPGG
jgi:hypothetical protein